MRLKRWEKVSVVVEMVPRNAAVLWFVPVRRVIGLHHCIQIWQHLLCIIMLVTILRYWLNT